MISKIAQIEIKLGQTPCLSQLSFFLRYSKRPDALGRLLYLYTETDEMDLTYFIDYQCSIVLRAIASFQKVYENTRLEIEQFDQWLKHSGLDKQLSEKAAYRPSSRKKRH